MKTEPENNADDHLYQVVSVCKVETPEGMTGNNWHHYVIGQGHSKIDGYKQGTQKAVTEHANNMANNLNERAAKGYSAYAVSKKKSKDAKTSS